jgi:hypothetical protein
MGFDKKPAGLEDRSRSAYGSGVSAHVGTGGAATDTIDVGADSILGGHLRRLKLGRLTLRRVLSELVRERLADVRGRPALTREPLQTLGAGQAGGFPRSTRCVWSARTGGAGSRQRLMAAVIDANLPVALITRDPRRALVAAQSGVG